MNDIGRSSDSLASILKAGGYHKDDMMVLGRYHAIFRTANGDIYYEEEFDNLVTAVGKQLLLDSVLGPSAYTLVGPFMGLIGAQTAVPAVGDTLSSHTNWAEASGATQPFYNGTRLTLTFGGSTVASGNATKQTSSTNTFTFTAGASGSVTGALIVTGSGATNVATATTGVLFSAGNLTTAQPVIATNTLTLTYSTTLT